MTDFFLLRRGCQTSKHLPFDYLPSVYVCLSFLLSLPFAPSAWLSWFQTVHHTCATLCLLYLSTLLLSPPLSPWRHITEEWIVPPVFSSSLLCTSFGVFGCLFIGGNDRVCDSAVGGYAGYRVWSVDTVWSLPAL